jgi:hypothetical protein
VNFCGFLVIQVASGVVLKLLGVFRTVRARAQQQSLIDCRELNGLGQSQS